MQESRAESIQIQKKSAVLTGVLGIWYQKVPKMSVAQPSLSCPFDPIAFGFSRGGIGE
jgi:hypothetical protein